MSGWLDWLNSCDFMKARVTQLIQVQEEGRSQREHLSEVTQSLVSKILYPGGSLSGTETQVYLISGLTNSSFSWPQFLNQGLGISACLWQVCVVCVFQVCEVQNSQGDVRDASLAAKGAAGNVSATLWLAESVHFLYSGIFLTLVKVMMVMM